MSLSIATASDRWARTAKVVVRHATPALLLAALAVVTWWAGPLFLLVDLFAVACWRTPDPQRIRVAVEMAVTGLVLLLAAVATLVWCVRGHVE